MFLNRLILSLSEFVLSVFLAIFVVFWSYKSFSKLTADYDLEEELKKDNVAVAVLLTALMVATSLMMQNTVYPVIGTLTVFLTSFGSSGISVWQLIGYSIGHLVGGFVLAFGTIRMSLWLFQKLLTEIDEEKEIRRGNVAVSMVMAGVVLVIALYMQSGVSGLAKTLIPQPELGEIQVLH